MPDPILEDDLVQGLVKFALSKQELTEAVSSFGASGVPWIFQDQIYARVEGKSGATAVVFSLAGGWGSPNVHNTLRVPRISMEIWADPIRDSAHNVIAPEETRRRTMLTYALFDKYLHRPSLETVCWGTVRTISSTRLGEISLYKVPDGDGLVRGQVFYGVTHS